MTVDGGRFSCTVYKNLDMRNAYYEDCTRNFEVTILVMFIFFENLKHAALNFSGSLHNSKLLSMSNCFARSLEMT